MIDWLIDSTQDADVFVIICTRWVSSTTRFSVSWCTTWTVRTARLWARSTYLWTGCRNKTLWTRSETRYNTVTVCFSVCWQRFWQSPAPAARCTDFAILFSASPRTCQLYRANLCMDVLYEHLSVYVFSSDIWSWSLIIKGFFQPQFFQHWVSSTRAVVDCAISSLWESMLTGLGYRTDD